MRIESLIERRGVGLARLAFFAALATALYEAFMPDHLHIHNPWDKAGHFTVFYTLTVLGLAAFPRVAVAWLMLSLAVCGAGIELVQAIPIVGRDAEWGDLAADCLGVVFAVAPALAWRVRRAAKI